MRPARGERRHAETEPSEVFRLGEPRRRPWPPSSEELQARIAELERERDALEDFAARAAHELVAPLVTIEAYSTSVAERLQPEEDDARRDLARVGGIAVRARRLVETLLYSTRSPAAIAQIPVNLGEVTAEAAAGLKHEIADRGAHLEVGRLPRVCGDPALLMSLMTNLLVNALRYGSRRDARIAIAATRQPSGDWRMTVDSAGTPMDSADRERIFGPYERGRNERRSRGAGLGLAICRDIVTRHGGRIGAVPIEGGNRFWFTLPPDELSRPG